MQYTPRYKPLRYKPLKRRPSRRQPPPRRPLSYSQEPSPRRRAVIRRRTLRASQWRVILYLAVLAVIGWYAFNSFFPTRSLPGTGHSIEGPPTISAAKIDQILCHAGSPACGEGLLLYSEGVTANINPAYALAFFQHESNFGLSGVARQTHSLGNIRCTPGAACIDGFTAYPTWSDGFQAWYALMNTLYIGTWHLTTVEQIIPKYAPSSDGNDEQAYIAAVNKAVQEWSQ